MDVFFGLISAVSFGLLDIVITYVVQRVHALHILVLAHAVAALGLLLFLLLPTPFHITTTTTTLVLLLCIGIGIGLVSTLTNLSLYKALELGPLALVSPVTASYGLVTMMLAAVAFQSVPSLSVMVLLVLTLAGMGLVIAKQDTATLLGKHLHRVVVPVGLALGLSVFVALCLWISLQSFLLAPWLVLFCCFCEGACVFLCCCLALARFLHAQKRMSKALLPHSGLLFAVGALSGFGIEYFLLSLTSQHLGPVQPVMASRLFSSLFFLACSGKARVGKWHTITLGQVALIGLIGLFDLVGTLCYTIGARENTFLVAALSSTYPLLPFLVGIYLGRERVSRKQWVGIVSMIIGMVGVSFLGK